MSEESPKVVKASPTKAPKTPKIHTLPTGAKILHAKCKQVKEITPGVLELAHALEDYLRMHRDDELQPVGISAPQLGKSIRVSSFILTPTAEPTTIINPELVYEKKRHLVTETCLSLPGKTFLLKRGKIAKMRGMLIDGSLRTFKGHGITAQIFLHELNHLDGITLDIIGEKIR